MNTRIIVQLDDKYYEVPRTLAQQFVACAGAIREVRPPDHAHHFYYLEKAEVDITISVVSEGQVKGFAKEEKNDGNEIIV